MATKKRKGIRIKHRNRSFKRRNKGRQIVAATNAIHISKLLEKLAPSEEDEEEHYHQLTIDDIRAIASLNYSTDGNKFDMSEKAITTKMIQLCINTLGSDAITPEEQALGYYTRKKLKKLDTWNEWLAGEAKQIDQFHFQGMFGDPVERANLPKEAIILRTHWQYVVKRNGVRRSRMCYNGSKRAAPQLQLLHLHGPHV